MDSSLPLNLRRAGLPHSKDGDVAAWLHVAAHCLCAEEGTDRYLAKNRLRELIGSPNPQKYARLLVECGVWEQAVGGWLLGSVGVRKPTAAQIERERERAREGMRMLRRNKPTCYDVTDTVTGDVTEAVTKKERKEPKERKKEDVGVVLVWEAWLAATGKSPARTKLSPDRRRLIAKWLGQYSVDDLVAAAKGWRHDPFYCGENDRNIAYGHRLKVVFKSNDNIEKFRDLELQNLSEKSQDSSFKNLLNRLNSDGEVAA